MGLGRNSVSSRSRVPWPPHRITTFMFARAVRSPSWRGNQAIASQTEAATDDEAHFHTALACKWGSFFARIAEAQSRVRDAQVERRFPNRLRSRGRLGGHLATWGHFKPVWKPALRWRGEAPDCSRKTGRTAGNRHRSVNVIGPYAQGVHKGCTPDYPASSAVVPSAALSQFANIIFHTARLCL